MKAKFTDSKCYIMDHNGQWVEIDCETNEPKKDTDEKAILDSEGCLDKISQGPLGIKGNIQGRNTRINRI